jgi:glycosyltransferase involved in cell wall biosynthesis
MNQSIKVLHYVHETYPHQVGYTIRTHYIAKNLMKLGYQVYVANQVSNDTKTLKKVGLNVGNNCQIDGVTYLSPPSDMWRNLRSFLFSLNNCGIPRIWKLANQINLFPNYLSWLKKQIGHPDIVHAHSPHNMAVEALYLSNQFDVPLVYEVRGFWSLSIASDNETEIDISEAIRSDLKACGRADRVVAICNGIAEQLISKGIPAKKITVIPNGVDTAKFHSRDKDVKLAKRLKVEQSFVYGYITNVRRLEGIQTVIQAWPKILEKIPNAVFLLIGEGAFINNLKSMVEVEGLSRYFRFIGRVPHSEIISYYSLIDVFVVPRIPEPVCHMVTPLKPLEAMSIGIPIVASDVDALKEFIKEGESGLLFRSADHTSLSDTCIRLAKEDELRIKLSENARTWVIENRDWSVIASQYQELYNNT